MTDLIAKHGGYENLKSYQMATLVYDLTVEFCARFVDTRNKTNKTDRTDETYKSYYWNRQADQMIQAARSGQKNIAEGSSTSGASKQNEIKLVTVARASLAELLGDYEDFLRQRGLRQWGKNDPEALRVRAMYRTDKTNKTYESYMSDSEKAANLLICLVNQTNYLLDQQLRSLEKELLKFGDLKERYKSSRSYKVNLMRQQKEDDEWLAEQSKRIKSESNKSLPAQAGNKSD